MGTIQRWERIVGAGHVAGRRLDATKLTWLSGLFALAVLATGAATAAVSYRGPNGACYSVRDQFISELGEVGVSRNASIFNTSLTLGGLTLAAFWLGLGRHLGTPCGYLIGAAGAVAGLSCGMVGVWPINYPGIHTVAAAVCFNCGLTAITLFSLAIHRERRGRFPRWLLVPGFLTMASVALFDSFSPPMALLQWSAAAAMLMWVGLTAVVLAVHKPLPAG